MMRESDCEMLRLSELELFALSLFEADWLFDELFEVSEAELLSEDCATRRLLELLA